MGWIWKTWMSKGKGECSDCGNPMCKGGRLRRACVRSMQAGSTVRVMHFVECTQQILVSLRDNLFCSVCKCLVNYQLGIYGKQPCSAIIV